MNPRNYFDVPQPVPICSGTGLIALDIVINAATKTSPKLWAGGSCGNVLTILSYLGWEAYPIARLGKNTAAEKVKIDLKQFKIRLNFLELEEGGSTPIIIEQIRIKKNGNPTHSFLLVCPECGFWLPRYKPILLKKAQDILDKLPESKTFYFDKVSPGNLKLAHTARARGSLVVFEPSSIGNKALFQKALQTCHVLKYAHDRLGHIEGLTEEVMPLLQVETFGAQGLRYRRQVGNKYREPWRMMPAYEMEGFRDAAGSGDWCTAGMIHLLGWDGAARFESITDDEIAEGLRFGQALAALNCLYEGARGAMYALNEQDLRSTVEKIMLGEQPKVVMAETLPEESDKLLQCVCPGCIQQWDRTETDSQIVEQDIVAQSVGLV